MAKILGILSLMIDAIVRQFWKHYSDQEMAAEINRHFELKGKKRITPEAVCKRRAKLKLKRDWHFKPKTKRPPLVIDEDSLKVDTATPTRESDMKIIKEVMDANPKLDRASLIAKLQEKFPRFNSRRALLSRLTDLKVKLPEASKTAKETPKERKTLSAFTDVSGLRSYISSEIDSGVLVREGAGVGALFREAGLRYNVDLQRQGHTLTLEQFTEMVKELVWNNKAQESLADYLRHARDPDEAIAKWQKSYSHIPLEWVKEQAKWVRGVSSAVAPVAMLPGLGGYLEKGWSQNVPNVELPSSSFDQPHKIALAQDAKCQFAVFNGMNLGLVYNPVIEENPLRRKLAEAELNGLDVVFLTNVFSLQVMKAGGALMVYRARLAGLNTNTDLLDPEYREEAARIIRDKPDDEVVFEAPMVRVINLITGLHKIMMKPDGTDEAGKPKFKPEFSGKVCMVLGHNEEELFNTLAYWVLNYLRILKQNVLRGEIALAAHDMVVAKKNHDLNAYQEAERRHARLKKQHVMCATSSITPTDVNRFVPPIRSIILTKLRELVPNIEVIGQGTTYVQLNDKPVTTLHIPGHKRVSDTLLADFAAKSGPKIIRQQLAKLTVICHPYALQMRDTVREADHDGKRDSAQIFVAPILVDGKFLRSELHDVIRSTHPIQRAIFHEQFKPGALRFSYHGEANIVAQDFWPITRPLPTIHLHRKSSKTQEVAYPNFGKAPYIYLATATDPHLGGRARQTVSVPELNCNLGMFEAIAHSMRVSKYLDSEKFGIHMWSCNDDGVQGHNYDTERQPDSQQIPNVRLEEISRDYMERMKKAKTTAEREAIFGEYQRFIHTQVDKRGLDWVQHQVEDLFERFITPNVDYFSAVLSRAKRSGLILKPASEHFKVPFDNRDLGVINWGSGNHFDHSVESMLTEGFLYERDLREKLLQREEWRGERDRDLLRKWVRAPLYSNFFCAWGTIKIDGGYEWGMDLRPSPTRMGSWGDTLMGAIRNDPLRGNPTRFMEGKTRIQTYGDKHFFGSAMTPDVIFHMCASGTHTDRYGEHGFPPNNTGVSFLGIPVEGPRLPFLFRYVRYDQIVELMKPGVTFDWESFLPNPA